MSMILRPWDCIEQNHRYLRKVDCSSFVMCPPQALSLPGVFLWQPPTVLTKQTRDAVDAINQSIFNVMSMNRIQCKQW